MKAKFKIGQKVWYMSDNTVYDGVVTGIFSTTSGIFYHVDEMDPDSEFKPRYQYTEDLFFISKEALIKSL